MKFRLIFQFRSMELSVKVDTVLPCNSLDSSLFSKLNENHSSLSSTFAIAIAIAFSQHQQQPPPRRRSIRRRAVSWRAVWSFEPEVQTFQFQSKFLEVSPFFTLDQEVQNPTRTPLFRRRIHWDPGCSQFFSIQQGKPASLHKFWHHGA